METQLKVSYFLNNRQVRKDGSIPIYMKISYSNRVVHISTGMTIHEGQWNKNTRQFIGNTPEVKSKNESLKLLELKIWKTVNGLIQKGTPFTLETIKNEMKHKDNQHPTIISILNIYIERIEKLLNKEYTPSTLQKYSTTRMRISEFIHHRFKRNDVFIHEVNNSFVMDFLDYLKVNLGNQPKTIQKHYQRLHTMIHHSVKRGLIEKVPFNEIRVKVPPKLVTYLTQEEIDRIEMRDFKNERLNIIRDMFIFSVYSGFSYTELKNFHESHIRMIEGQLWVEMIRQKTQRPYKVPLLPKCVELIERYKEHPKRKENGLLLPLPTNQKFNCYLKEIQDLCSINTKLTCHLGRRTFGSTILLKNNVNIHVISQLLGHSNTSITIKSYLGSVPELMLGEFQKIKNVYEKD
jgi:integrase